MESHLLHSFKILTKNTVQQVRVLMGRLSVLNVLRSVQEPQGDLELLRIGNHRDDLRDLLLCQLSSALIEIDVAFLANDVGESSTDTLEKIV
jgi:hypothetical protein